MFYLFFQIRISVDSIHLRWDIFSPGRRQRDVRRPFGADRCQELRISPVSRVRRWGVFLETPRFSTQNTYDKHPRSFTPTPPLILIKIWRLRNPVCQLHGNNATRRAHGGSLVVSTRVICSNTHTCLLPGHHSGWHPFPSKKYTQYPTKKRKRFDSRFGQNIFLPSSLWKPR